MSPSYVDDFDGPRPYEPDPRDREIERLRAGITWALGYTDFRPRKPGEGAYWWRKELRERAGLPTYVYDKATRAVSPVRSESKR